METFECGWCNATGKNAMGVRCSKCAGTGKVDRESAPAPKAVTKGTLRAEKGGFIVSSGKPRYAYMQGKHYVVGRGTIEEFETVAAAYARVAERLRDERVKA